MLNVSDVSYSANIHSQYSNYATVPVSWVHCFPYKLSQVCLVWRHGREVNSVFDESLNKVPHAVKADDSGGQRNSGLSSFPYRPNRSTT